MTARTFPSATILGTALCAAAIARPQPADVAHADEVRALIGEMLADAESRSSLLAQSPPTAGHDGRFFLASPDGAFRLNVSGQLQFRAVANFRDPLDPAADDFDTGFQNRRTKLQFDGMVLEPGLFFRVVTAFFRGEGPFEGGPRILEEAAVGKRFDNGWTLVAGQFRLPFIRESVVSSRYQLAVERSFVSQAFNIDFVQGVTASFQADRWRAFFAVSDGLGSRNTDLLEDPADYALTARGEWAIAGEWERFRDFTSPRGSDVGAMLGAGAHFEDTPDFPGALNTQSLLYTVDLSIEGDGWNLYAAAVGGHQETEAPGVPTLDDFGFVAQAGLHLTDRVEIFSRWEGLLPDTDRGGPPAPGGDAFFQAVTGGVNAYLHGHAAKFTADVVYIVEGAAANVFLGTADPDAYGPRSNGPYRVAGRSVLGVLGSSQDGEVALRAQFQVLF